MTPGPVFYFNHPDVRIAVPLLRNLRIHRTFGISDNLFPEICIRGEIVPTLKGCRGAIQCVEFHQDTASSVIAVNHNECRYVVQPEPGKICINPEPRGQP